jgi:hypothetical protein
VPKENKWGDKSRFYNVKGKQYPSVTTILSVINKPALMQWAAKMEREMVLEASATLYLDVRKTKKMSDLGWRTALNERLGRMKASQKELAKASEIGSQAHEWIEWQIKSQLLHEVGPCPVIGPAAMLAVSAWQRWKNSVSFKPLLCEQPVWSEYYEYAGTMDLLAEVNGEPMLLDWKTGKRIYEEAYLQNAAYRFALEEMGLVPHTDERIKGMIVRLPKIEGDPDFEAREVPGDLMDLMDVFLNARSLWKWLNAKETLVEVGAPK